MKEELTWGDKWGLLLISRLCGKILVEEKIDGKWERKWLTDEEYEKLPEPPEEE